MSGLDLRPLSTGEILDRTFTLYRRHFLFFVGLAAIPEVPAVAVNLASMSRINDPSTAFSVASLIVVYFFSLLAYVFSQGGAVVAVSHLYMGHSITIAESLRRTGKRFVTITAILIMNAVTVGAGLVFLIAPGVFLLCRLLVSVPVALIEGRRAGDSLSRSFRLTEEYGGRAFLILLLYFVLMMGAGTIESLPVAVSFISQGPAALASQSTLALTQILSFVVSSLVTPILLISISVFYYDLRVRKEAYDLQVMMGPPPAPDAPPPPPAEGPVPARAEPPPLGPPDLP